MTALASELDRKLSELDSERARLLEHLVRDAMALAESSPAGSKPGPDLEAEGTMEVQKIKLSAQDYDLLCRWLDEPPRDLPRLRQLMREPSIFKNA